MKDIEFVNILNENNEENIWEVGEGLYEYPVFNWQTEYIGNSEEVKLESITISTNPTKINYIEGEVFDRSGMVVTATYNNGTSKTVTNYTASPSRALTIADNKVIVSYTEGGITKTADVSITVVANSDPISEPEYVLGDANGDGEVDFSDILTINKHRLGKVMLTGVNLEAADVTGDGKADFSDILQINKYRLGKINSL